MAHVSIATTVAGGNMVADAVDKFQRAAEQLHRVRLLANTLPNAAAYEGGIMGGAVGSGPDYASALNSLDDAVQATVAAQSGQLSTLDNGVVNP